MGPTLRCLPVVTLTSSDARDDISRCYDAEANAYLTKPTDRGDFIALTSAIERFWHRSAQLPRLQSNAPHVIGKPDDYKTRVGTPSMADDSREIDPPEHEPAEHLKRVRERLQHATAGADRPIQTQLHSITAGVYEEQDGSLTRREPEPKRDRIEELATKLDGLVGETSGETTDHIEIARDHCLAYLEEGGGEEPAT